MKTIFILLCIVIITNSQDAQQNITPAPEEDNNIEQFEKKVSKTITLIENYTKELLELAHQTALKNLETEMKQIFKDADEIIAKFNESRRKTERDLKECGDRFLGESSVLRHLLELSVEIDFSIQEVHACPKNFAGMECLINALVRGEALFNDADGIIEAEKGTPNERAENLIKWIEKCNKKTIEIAKDAMKILLNKIKTC